MIINLRCLIKKSNIETIDLKIDSLFGDAPKKIISDTTKTTEYSEIEYFAQNIYDYVEGVLSLESVACKDWLTNKVDRCVTGRIAQQQTVGEVQLPLSNCGVVSLDYDNYNGVATSIGHSPITGLINPSIGSINSIGESLTNIVWAPLASGIKSISLSANWMWPCGNEGEDSRLYDAVGACSRFAIELGINIPTGKDSLSMVQKYDSMKVKSPGTVIISASGHCEDIRKVVKPVLNKNIGDIYYIDMSFDELKLGGSSFAQTQNKIGTNAPTINDSNKFKDAFNLVQDLIRANKIKSGHDISSGGMITTLLELCFSSNKIGMDIDLTEIGCSDTVKLFFSENAGLIIPVSYTHLTLPTNREV